MTEDQMTAVIADLRQSLAALRHDLGEFRERVIRVEVKTEHLTEMLNRIEAHTASMDQKLDTTNTVIAKGVGGMLVGGWVGHALAAIAGFAAAHLWPLAR
jgi:hypothetical protein